MAAQTFCLPVLGREVGFEAFWRTIDRDGKEVWRRVFARLVLFSYVDRLDIGVRVPFLAFRSRFHLYAGLSIAEASSYGS